MNLVLSLIAGGWLIALLLIVRDTSRLAAHDASLRQRAAALARIQWLHRGSVVFLSAGLLLLVLIEDRYQQLPLADELPVRWILAILIVLFLLLVSLIAVLPDFPGRARLGRLETATGAMLVLIVALVEILTIRGGSWPMADSGATVVLALALMLGFMIIARLYLGGAVIVAEHILSHGSHPSREATLKRLLRRYRPLLIASAAALGVALFFSQ